MAEDAADRTVACDATDPLVDLYGLTPQRAADIRASTHALEAVVLRLAAALPFEAEPWGFGEQLVHIALRHEPG